MGGNRAQEPDQIDVRKAALMWISFIYTQATRLEEAIDMYAELLESQQFIETYEARRRPKEWTREAKKARSLLERTPPPTVAADKYFFLVSVAQLVKCVRLLPADGLPNFDDHDLMKHLRNIEEHWEEPNGRSLNLLRQSIPDIAPGRISFTKDDIYFEGVSFVRLLQWTKDVEMELRLTGIADSRSLLDPSATHPFPYGSRAFRATRDESLPPWGVDPAPPYKARRRAAARRRRATLVDHDQINRPGTN